MKTKSLIFIIIGLFFSACALIENGIWRSRGLEGAWYSGGARDRVAGISQGRDGLEARNENGQVSRLQWDGKRAVVALDWDGGLRGDFSNNRIEWANGSFWVRSDVQQTRLEGTWYSGGARDKVAGISQGRDGLEARNEIGQVSRLQWDGRRAVEALDWGGLRGDFNNNRIDWANGSFWTR